MSHFIYDFPTIQEVRKASKDKIYYWFSFLGESRNNKEKKIWKEINKRFTSITPPRKRKHVKLFTYEDFLNEINK